MYTYTHKHVYMYICILARTHSTTLYTSLFTCFAIRLYSSLHVTCCFRLLSRG